jgi:hypothetical protein
VLIVDRSLCEEAASPKRPNQRIGRVEIDFIAQPKIESTSICRVEV